MRITHEVPNAKDLNIDDTRQLINTMFDLVRYPDIAPFRVGSIAVTILDLTVGVLFSRSLPDNNYMVFLQPQSNIAVEHFASNLRADGFTLNLSLGVAATFSYLAIGIL